MDKKEEKNSISYSTRAFLLLIFVGVLLFLNISKQTNAIETIKISDELFEIKETEVHKKAPSKSALKLASEKIIGEIVVFNPTSKKFHRPDCPWAKKCKRCVKTGKVNAMKRGGVPCKVCADN